MKQSRLMSLVESVANVIAGYGVAVVAQLLIFPVFGLHATLAQTLQMGVVFTLVSILRSYALRRLFEALLARKCQRNSAAREGAAEKALPIPSVVLPPEVRAKRTQHRVVKSFARPSVGVQSHVGLVRDWNQPGSVRLPLAGGVEVEWR